MNRYIIILLLANQSSCPQLDHGGLGNTSMNMTVKMDLKWQVAMISMRMKKFYKKTGRKLQFDAKEPVGFDKTKVECYNCHKTGHFAREYRIKGNQDNRRRDAWNSGTKDGSRTGKKEDSKALVTIDGEGVDWTKHSEEDEDYALMACNSSESDTEVTSCSNKCKESYANLKKLYDAQREQLSDASIEIKAYSQGLKKVEAQLVAHQQGQLWYEQKIKFMKIDLDDKTDVLTYHKKLLAEAQKEKEDLKAKGHRYDGILSYENEVLQSVFMNKESELEKQPLYDRSFWSECSYTLREYESDSEDEVCDFHEKRMARKAELNNGWNKNFCGQREGKGKRPFGNLIAKKLYNGGPVGFGGSKGYITGKGKIKTGKLDFEDVCFVKELQHFNLFSVSQMWDKKKQGSVLHDSDVCFALNLVNKKLITMQVQKTILGCIGEDIISAQGENTALYCNYGLLMLNHHSDDSEIPPLKDIYQNSSDGIFTTSSYDDEGAVADFTNLETVVNVSPIPKSRIISSHPSAVILGDPTSAVQTRSKDTKSLDTGIVLPFGKKAIAQSGFSKYGRIEAIRIFLAFASYMGFIVYQMDVKSAFLYGKIDEEVYVSQPPGFLDPKYPQKVYKVGYVYKALMGYIKLLEPVQVYVDDIIFGSTKKSWCDEFEALMKSRFQMSSMGELTFFLGLQVKQKEDGIFISQDKYVAEILKKFDFANVKTASTPIETQKPLVKDEEASDVDVHLYRSMIGSLMYLTASRPDIMFAVCACSRFQVTPKSSHLSIVTMLEQILTGNPQQEVVNFLAGDSFLSNAKKQTIVATSTTEAEYVAAASCCGYHFIRDAYEKKLIQVLKIHTKDNVADLVTKAFDVSRGLIGFRESLRRGIDGTKALLIPTLFILCLDTVSTDSAKLVPLGKVCTAIETLKKNTAKALISLLTMITLLTTMAVLDSCPKHNMVAYMEKSEGNAEFHEIIDFLTRSFIHHALTVSPVVSTTFVEQFWTSAKSKIINNVRHITAKVDGKPVSISKASIRSDLLFDDANGIDSLPNQVIFDAIQLMGHLDAKKKFVMYPRFISIFLDKQLANVPVPLDHFPVNALTSKVFSFMVKKGKHFSGKVTPLFASMLVQPTEDEGAPSERPSEAQPTPSPAHTSEVPIEQQTDPSPRPSPSTIIPDSIPESSGGNLGGHSSSDKSLLGNEGEMTLQSVYDLCLSLCAQVSDQAKRQKDNHLKATGSKSLQKQAKTCHPNTTKHRNQSVLLEAKDWKKRSSKKQWVHTESVSKQGREVAIRQIEGTDEQIKSTDEQRKVRSFSTCVKPKQFPREKEKGVELKDIEETNRPRPTSIRSLLTLKPLPKIDPKDKGKKKIEEDDESESKSDGIPEADKKFKRLASDEEMARKIQE
ncbi:putative ribonuclease H-like domain-containing protein [Tanacetum coccineum]